MTNTLRITFLAFLVTLLLSSCAGVSETAPATNQSANGTPSVAKAASSDLSFPNYASVSSSADFDAKIIAELEQRVEQFVSDGDTKGIATLLVKDGQVVSYKQAGIRREANAEPITEDTIYRIYSMTKPVTGVALMMLYEQGRFSLDDPINKYIPEFEDLKVVKSVAADGSFEVENLNRQPTMRELMSHTAGFAYGLGGTDPSNLLFMKNRVLASPDLNTMVDRVAAIPLMSQPGEQWFYSIAVDLQGVIVERLSGMQFGDYLQSQIFTPLGMIDTGFHVPEAKYHRFSDAFAYHPKTKVFQKLPFSEPQYNFFDVRYRKETIGMESGGGGLASTLADYARFCQMLLNQGEFNGARILKPETIELMRTDVLQGEQRVSIAGTLAESDGDQLGFGLDFGIYKNPGNDPLKMGDGSYFWGGAAGTWFWIDPVNNLFFIGMIQRFPQGGPEVNFRFITRDLVYAALNQ